MLKIFVKLYNLKDVPWKHEKKHFLRFFWLFYPYFELTLHGNEGEIKNSTR